MVDCTLGTYLQIRHCSREYAPPKPPLLSRGRWRRSQSVYRPDPQGDLAITSVTIMVWEDGSPTLIAVPSPPYEEGFWKRKPAPPPKSTRYRGDLAGWQKLLYETGYAPLVGPR
ncbi:hypothetical protein [Actinomadura terrae]|uniref:hypothetical protein n=1 Tax=Actinomadura terrae TaxID=604353 RepID=UPI001FA70781|nr:hypothetical protein [Actinomadura terrae]